MFASGRNEYPLRIRLNGLILNQVIIDQHYKEKHPDVTDEIILELVKQLDKKTYTVEIEADGFQYFRVEPVFYNQAPYRLVLLLCVGEDYL